MIRLLGWPLRGLAFMVYLLPDSLKSGLAWGVALLWFDILRVRRRTALDNLQRAFPEWSAVEKRRVARRSLYNMGLTLIDFCTFPFLKKADFERMVEWENREHLDQALANRQGVLALSAHIGNGDWGGACLAQFDYKVHIISKVFKAQWLNDLWFNSRKSLGVQFIPPRKSSYQILKALKTNEIVVFVLDQYTGPPNGIKTKFFGHDTGTAVGLALLSSRAKAPVLPLYTYRKGVSRHVIRAGPPILFVEADSAQESLRQTTQKYNDVVEAMVREHPEQWMWIHRRWKVGFA